MPNTRSSDLEPWPKRTRTDKSPRENEPRPMTPTSTKARMPEKGPDVDGATETEQVPVDDAPPANAQGSRVAGGLR